MSVVGCQSQDVCLCPRLVITQQTLQPQVCTECTCACLCMCARVCTCVHVCIVHSVCTSVDKDQEGTMNDGNVNKEAPLNAANVSKCILTCFPTSKRCPEAQVHPTSVPPL